MKGIGHQQRSLFKINHKHSLTHGGVWRNKKLGRGPRPLSCKEPLHLVLKANKSMLSSGSLRSRQNFITITRIIKKYSIRFHIKIEQVSVQADHIHLLIRATRRYGFHYFFRVIAGQMAQCLVNQGKLRVTDTPRSNKQANKLWKYRPFSRVVRGFRAYQIVRDYIELNEQEALGRIKYQKQRLRGLSMADWQLMWA